MNRSRHALSFSVIVLLACGYALPSPAYSQASAAAPDSAQLDKLVAPIALYPDPLVAQILPASTYPVQVVEAARGLANGGRPDRATASQWDPSIQALLSFPTVLKMMSDKINWTTQLGQAVAANQANVMGAIQRVRHEAQAAGNLTSNDKQVVSLEGSGDSSTIIIQPANPQYIYVPQYNPVAILSPPPIYFGNVPAPAYGLLTFGAGFAAGAATAYACNWGYGDGSVTASNYYHYSPTDTYAAYHPTTGTYSAYNPATGNSARYNPKTGTYTGYDAKTGTYGAYNPATGKYGTYDPSTGAYNKSGTTGTYKPGTSGSYSAWHPRESSDVGRSTDDYRASQYGAGGSRYSGGDLASGSQLGSSPASGAQYRDSGAARGAGTASGGQLGGGWSGLGSRDFGANADRGFGGGWGGGRGFGDAGFGGGDRGSARVYGGDSFRGLGGGGWDARAASDRGFASFGGRGGGFRR
jgi:hypothetical protein